MNAMNVLQQVFDVKAPDIKGMFVMSSWQIPTGFSSAASAGITALGSVSRRGNYAWMWFLIPAITILTWLLSLL